MNKNSAAGSRGFHVVYETLFQSLRFEILNFVWMDRLQQAFIYQTIQNCFLMLGCWAVGKLNTLLLLYTRIIINNVDAALFIF